MDVRPIAPHELTAWRQCLHQTFAGDLTSDPLSEERHQAIIDPTRTFAAFDGPALVATAASFTFDVSVPGGARVPMAGLTMVTVRPTHRRRGILRRLIDLHLADARARGEPVSGLFASEATIYGRFGYGVAAEADVLQLDAAGARLDPPPDADTLTLVPEAEAEAAMPTVYDRVLATRPGMFTRTPAWWHYRRILDRPETRGGTSARRFLLARRGPDVTGYLIYRQKLGWEQGAVAGTLDIDELCAVDAHAEATLWSFVVNVDLFPRVAWAQTPTDAPLAWLVDDRRRLVRRRADTLWLRIEDVPRMLAARTYPVDGALTLVVDGAPTTLVVEGGHARATPGPAATPGTPELHPDRAALGSLYLGAFAPSLLARAGRLRGAPPALAAADRLFASAVAPWCPEIF